MATGIPRVNTNDLSSSYLPSIITEVPQCEMVGENAGEYASTAVGDVAENVNVCAAPFAIG